MDQKLEHKRHTLAHLLAAAALKHYPNAKVTLGPVIENGFYYDIDFGNEKLGEADLKKLEKTMRKLLPSWTDVSHKTVSIDEAKQAFQDNQFKLELIDEIHERGEDITLYTIGDFTDLCEGGHCEKPAANIAPDSFKLDRIAGAYWRGDEKNPMLTRIYGLAFNTKQELDKYLKIREEAEARNHRKIGKEMGLFANINEIGQGLPVWLPNGYAMRRAIEDYMIHLERTHGYDHVLTPHISNENLFKKSGHLGFYDESMYAPIHVDDEKYYLKPMNCPAAMMIYKMKPHSYRELPIKLGEFGTVYRYEQSGELHGLQRVRGFTQNDAHIFCTPEQLEDQFLEVLDMIQEFYKAVGFDNYTFRLSLSDSNNQEKYVGESARWKEVEAILRKALNKSGVDFYEAEGEAAFYGPKLDVQAVNVFGKEDSVSTIQVDFNLPERFDITYIDANNEKKRPYVIHRALIGSFERFFAFLIEHHAGVFPFWFAPVQVKVLPVSEKHAGYAQEVLKKLKMSDIRAELDANDESLGKRIRQAKVEKVPYFFVVGDKEVESNSVTVENRKESEGPHKLEGIIQRLQEEIKTRAN